MFAEAHSPRPRPTRALRHEVPASSVAHAVICLTREYDTLRGNDTEVRLKSVAELFFFFLRRLKEINRGTACRFRYSFFVIGIENNSHLLLCNIVTFYFNHS